MGRNGYVFDLGVDQHSGGKWQLEEAAQMIERAHEGVAEEDKVTFIISKSIPRLTFLTLEYLTTSRSPLQARPIRIQPNRSKFHRLAKLHVPAQQMQQNLHEAKRVFLRDAHIPKEPAS